MKKYKIFTVPSIEEAEQMMNEMALQGWIVKAMVPWQTIRGPRLAVTFEKDA